MSNIQFEEDYNYNVNNNMNIINKNNGGLSSYLVRKGWFKEERSASIAMLIVSILLLVVSILLLVRQFSADKNTKYLISEEILNRLPVEIQEKIKNTNEK